MTTASDSLAFGSSAHGRHPTVSIVSVNYNGLRYLEPFLTSMLAIDYPREAWRVVLVDNASTDASTAFVREKFPWVHLVESPSNLGFAGGCNLGIQASRSDYVALVNNDTIVESEWLRRLVELAESDPRIGLAGSKMLFLTPFLDLGLETVVSDPPAPGSPGEVALVVHEARVEGCAYDKLIFRAGRIATHDDAGQPVHLLTRSARLAVPVNGTELPATLVLTLRTASLASRVTVGIVAGDTEIERVSVGPERQTVQIMVPREIVARATHNMINNAGTRVDGEGAFGDRGIWEFDEGQYDLVSDVPALCGASVLLRRAMLDRVGGFDTRFFMYFEDVDLSWRARRDGWRLVYTPDSRLRHVHSGSSQEGSPFWVFFVSRNHLFWLIKHGTARAAAHALATFYAKALRQALRAVGRWLRGRPATSSAVDAVPLQVARSLTLYLPGLLVSRYRTPDAGSRDRWTRVDADSGPR